MNDPTSLIGTNNVQKSHPVKLKKIKVRFIKLMKLPQQQ